MKLTDLFTPNKQIETGGKTSQQSSQHIASINRQIQSLKPGQTLQGEVIAKNGSEVQVKVAEDFVVKARVDQNINLEMGKPMTFEVKNNGQTLTLLPLYTNTATDANVLKALDMASLPINTDTIAMTEQMMKAGLSIDKNSLQQVFRESNLYSQSNIADILDLHRLSMPVNEENVTQITSYKNLANQLSQGLDAVTNALSDTLQSMVRNGEVDGAARLFQDIMNLVSEISSQTEGTDGNQKTFQDVPLMQQAVGEQPMTPSLQVEYQQLLDLLSSSQSMEGIQLGITQGTERLVMANQEQLSVVDGEVVSNQTDVGGQLQRLLQQGMAANDRVLIKNLIGNKKVMNFVKDRLLNIWTIRSQDVAEGENVTKLYKRLDKQLKGLTQALEQANQTGSESYRAVTGLSQNVDFLQQLNQTYTYIQLPLRLQQGNQAHGDLYVYSNKKHLAASDGKITALLHLDMEYLGPVDVYVAMQQEKVNTKFYVQDEMLDFLEQHMDILTKRLEKRGYHCQCEMQVREEEEEKETGVIDRLLNKTAHMPLVQYAFDVRT